MHWNGSDAPRLIIEVNVVASSHMIEHEAVIFKNARKLFWGLARQVWHTLCTHCRE